MPKKIHLNLEKLKNLIEVQKLQQWKVAEILGVSEDTIRRNCKKLGLHTQRSGPRGGDQHPEWKGGQSIISGYLYIYMPEHPNSTKQNRVAYHRLLMEKHLGRYLDKKEVVHHINGDTLDNRIDNLRLFANNGEHLRSSLKGKIPNWTPEGKIKILEAVKKTANLRKSGAYG